MKSVNPDTFEALGDFKWIARNHLSGRKIASFQADTFTFNNPNGGDYFKHGCKDSSVLGIYLRKLLA